MNVVAKRFSLALVLFFRRSSITSGVVFDGAQDAMDLCLPACTAQIVDASGKQERRVRAAIAVVVAIILSAQWELNVL